MVDIDYSDMRRAETKGDKDEVRQETHLTRPPRLEGKVKNAKMNPVKKKKRADSKKSAPKKQRDLSEKQRKEYQLKSKHH